jgi:hypothetical protein
MRQAKTAEPRPQLETLLQRLLIVVLIGRVFNDNCVVSLVKDQMATREGGSE